MTKLKLGQEYFYLQHDMVKWAHANLGPGGWRKPDRERWGDNWGLQVMFGCQTWYFVDEKDAIMFELKWR